MTCQRSCQGHARLGAANAALTLTTEVIGDPPRHIPQIASRTGLDLRPLNARNPQDHRWIIAQTFPEFREQRRQLATALDIVAQTDIRMVAGNALETLPAILAQTPDPVCIFHSVCLSYWTDAERTAAELVRRPPAGQGRRMDGQQHPRPARQGQTG